MKSQRYLTVAILIVTGVIAFIIGIYIKKSLVTAKKVESTTTTTTTTTVEKPLSTITTQSPVGQTDLTKAEEDARKASDEAYAALRVKNKAKTNSTKPELKAAYTDKVLDYKKAKERAQEAQKIVKEKRNAVSKTV